ncbi:hypothetical protein EVAR_76213_1 [Eumeta japonica]|uniref:Uncharacterized protein n=1 Tax=Eumeta variegata TaxID=151549 RepID=A0A4C1UP60_EUMVA|nr:hypothetical protein EVAR_76213_1 [Eumeta japonica]
MDTGQNPTRSRPVWQSILWSTWLLHVNGLARQMQYHTHTDYGREITVFVVAFHPVSKRSGGPFHCPQPLSISPLLLSSDVLLRIYISTQEVGNTLVTSPKFLGDSARAESLRDFLCRDIHLVASIRQSHANGIPCRSTAIDEDLKAPINWGYGQPSTSM